MARFSNILIYILALLCNYTYVFQVFYLLFFLTLAKIYIYTGSTVG